MEPSRRFHFFDKHLIALSGSAGQGAVVIESVVDTAGDDTFLWVLESSGRLNALYRRLGVDHSRNALSHYSLKAFEYEALRVFSCPQTSTLVVIGKDDDSDSMLKFNTYKVSAPSSSHECPDELLQFVQSVPLFSAAHGLTLDHIEAAAVSPCGSLAAIATSIGSVYVYRNYLAPLSEGDAQQLALSSFSVADVAADRNVGPVRSLHILPLSSGQLGLAVCCENSVLTLRLSPEVELLISGIIESSFEASCDLGDGCRFAVSKAGGMMDIYDMERGVVSTLKSCGACTSMCAYKGYIATASLDCKGGLEAAYATTLVVVQALSASMDFVAHSQHIPVVFKFERALSSLYVLARSGSSPALIVFELREKSIHERLQTLIRKRLFDCAISIATAERRPLAECEEIHKIHANWLYEKGHFEAAMEAYCRAGAAMEPAFVIGRLMPLNSKIHLYKYLVHLHRCGTASRVHTVVLMRALQSLFQGCSGGIAEIPTTAVPGGVFCEQLLHDFLEEFGESHKDGIRDALYDCRFSGGSGFARVVALAQHDHDEYVDILVEDFHDYSAALRYLGSVGDQAACNAILRHGRRLVKHDPGAVLAIIRRIASSMPQTQGNVHDAFVPVFCMEDRFLVDMLGPDTHGAPLMIFSTRIHLTLDQFAAHSRPAPSSHKLGALPSEDGSADVPITAADGAPDLPSDMRPSAKSSTEPRAHGTADFDIDGLENRMWKLLNGNTQLAEYQLMALILCLVYNYQRGANAMAIKMGYYHLPLVLAGMPQSHLRSTKFDLLNHALSYGYNEPTLWVGTLSLLVRSASDNSELVRDALRHIQTHRLLSFPSVLGILQKNATLRFGHVKVGVSAPPLHQPQEYLRHEFRKVDELLKDCERDIAQDKVDCSQMNRDLQRLQHSYFVINNTNCSRCELSLELPSLHFYCQHSFHTYCIGADGVCPKCSPIVHEAAEGHEPQQGSGHQDDFFKFLSGATDPFVYMAQQMERFAFSQP
ncbi:vacuolar protein sorting-associated protein 11 homolog [Babesia caballi]|uniref:Vacuolar protein sorting-associated protein 11 homolog n=1 Tax=Babesia caballi TaxID=5871 RepID=A0AAV4M0P9_BABCB|nr:vacuolar protein sorting-associated protein 11 homolog [Babesia caballi]